MRKIGKESAAPDNGVGSGNGWLSGHRCALILGVIVIVAFLLRFVFAYGVSADSSFALSGGAGAQYHLHVIESILDGSWSMTDSAVNYPIGGAFVVPPLMDFIAAGVASILGGTSENASMALGILAPIFGALACIPVFLIGKELYDKTIGVVAALIYAFLALPISTSVFSNGNEYALAAFLVAFAMLFAIKMVKAADTEDSTKGAILKNAIVAGIFLALAALTWNGFRSILVLFAIVMVVQVVASRIRGKDFSGILSGYSVILLVGAIIPAAYYIPADLMDAVYSGCLLVAVVSVVFAYLFYALRSKPWIVTIPGLVVAFVVFSAVLSIVASDLYTDFIFGNSVYQSSIMEELSSGRVSMSNVAAYYGWLTMWLPFCLGFYEAYCLIKKDRTATRLFTMLWLFGMAIIAWSSYANAAIVGCVFAVGSAGVIVGLIRKADLRSYGASIKAAGFPGCFRKLIKPFPFATVIIVAFLVVLPNVSFAVDAGMPSNTEDSDAFYYGNTNFTIKNEDSYPTQKIWSQFRDVDKDGAVVTWIDYAYDSVTQGGFSSLTDTNGNGASAAAQIYLADGAGSAVAAMALRIMMSNSGTDFGSCFTDSGVYATIAGFIQNPSSAISEIEANPDTYGNLRSNMTCENAVYLASIEAMTSAMNDAEIMEAYEKICDRTGEKLGYILVDASMLPLQYNDGDNFSTIAYFANYAVDKYGAATQYYSYNTYYGTTVYTDAIYDTLVWKALIGPSASATGYSSSYSQLSALALSDGSDDNAKAIPGYGLAGFEVASWFVMYNPDTKATLSSDGWIYMDGWEAMDKQKNEGGLINYLSSYVMLAYTGASSSNIVSGTVASSDGSAVSGATAEVYTYSDVYKAYVLSSKATTKADGSFEVLASGDYRVEIKAGDVILGTLMPSDFSGSSANVVVGYADFSGEVVVGDDVYDQERMNLALENSVAKYPDILIENGTFSVENIVPGTYSYTLTGTYGSSLATGSVTLYPGINTGFTVTPKTYTITVTVQDITGETISPGTGSGITVYATNQSTGAVFSAEVGKDGKAVVTAVPGKYNLNVGNGMVSSYTTTQNISSGNRTATVTAYESETVTIATGSAGSTVFTITGGTFSTISHVDDSGNTVADVPVGIGTDKMAYTLYALTGSIVQYGLITESGVTLKSADAVCVTGKIQNGTSGTSGTVMFMSKDLGLFQVSVAAASDGSYTAYIPAGSYTVYANNGSDMVAFSDVSISGSKQTVDVSLIEGRKVTATLKYDQATSDSNLAMPFMLAQISFEHNGSSYKLTSMTGTNGSSVFYIPDSTAAEVKFNEGALDNDSFSCSKLVRDVVSGTATTTATLVIDYYKSDSDNNHVKLVSFTAPCDMELEFYEDVSDKSFTMVAGETKQIRPGQYEIKIDGSTGYYFDGTAHIYPGSTEFADLDLIEVGKVNVTRGTTDVVKIESSYTGDDEDVADDAEGRHYRFDGGYYLEVGYTYFFTSTNGDKLAYGYVDMTAAATASMDITASADKMTVTGVVSVVGDGEIVVKHDGVTHVFSIENGAYTLTLPSTWTSADVEVSVDSSDDKYLSEATATFTGMKDGSIRNVALASEDAPVDDSDKDFTASLDSVTTSTSGELAARLTIVNKTESTMTYIVTSGSDLVLDHAFSVTIAALQTAHIDVTGKFDASRVALGSEGMTLAVTDINGSATETVGLVTSATGEVGTNGMTVSKAGDAGASKDKVSASQYMYALTFVNNDGIAKNVVINASVTGSWNGKVMILNADGTFATELGESVTVYGYQTVTYYLACMTLSSEKGEAQSAPSLQASVFFDGTTKALDLSPVSVSVDSGDVTVSGGDALLERSSVPGGIWFLLAVSILLIIAIFWLASKRGVFSRR